jgi:hypothetical protein
MAIFGVTVLPKQIKDHYNRQGGHPDDVSGVFIWNDNGTDSIEVQFHNNMNDVWHWTKLPEVRDPRFPRGWVLVESYETEDDEEEEDFDSGPVYNEEVEEEHPRSTVRRELVHA